MKILETCLYAEDLEAIEQFYQTVLGLQRLSKVAGRHVFFRCEGQVLLIFNPLETTRSTGDIPPHGAHGAGHVAFAVSHVEMAVWRARLSDAGIAIESEVTWPNGGQSIYFRDPAGNSLELATPMLWE